MYFKKALQVLSVVSLLSACGKDNKKNEAPVASLPPPPPTSTIFDHQVTGTVLFKGTVIGANVCVDLDMDQSCEDGEPNGISDEFGHYQIDWKSEVENPRYILIATWNSTASSVSQSQSFGININNQSSSPINIPTPSASTNGENILFALSNHQGEINSLTDIEFKRYQLMLTLNKTDIEIKQLKEQLLVILKLLYGIAAEDVYQVTVEESRSERFISTLEVQRYIFALIAEIVSDPLAVEEVMSASIETIRNLIELSNMTVLEYLAIEPLELIYVLNNTLMAQEYIEQPISNEIMS